MNSLSESIIANAGTDDDTADEMNSFVKKRKKGYVSNNFSNPHCLYLFSSFVFRMQILYIRRTPIIVFMT